MKRILISEAGGAPSINVVNSIRAMNDDFYLIGISTDKYLLALSDVDEKYLTPSASDPLFLPFLNDLITKTKPDIIFSQNDAVVEVLSKNRDEIKSKLFLPDHKTIELCHDKFATYKAWEKAQLKVPKTKLLNNAGDLADAFQALGPKIWLRAITGWSGKAAVCTDDFAFAESWINYYHGWGKFTAAEYLSPDSVTWMSLWINGNLIVAQGRKRIEWRFGHHSISGVTGQTGVGETISDKLVDEIALKAIKAIDKNPHGVFSVDMTLDSKGAPNLTEINIGRFFATSHFYSTAGLNMVQIILDYIYHNKIPKFKNKINPLDPGLIWVRQIDVEPQIFQKKDIEKLEVDFKDAVLSLSR